MCMKKKLLFLVGLFITQLSIAREIVVVIRGTNSNPPIYTEVTGLTDTLSVTPAVDATAIYVSLMDMQGTIYQQHCVPATCNDLLNVISPILPNGFMLEIRDDRGYIYRTFGD